MNSCCNHQGTRGGKKAIEPAEKVLQITSDNTVRSFFISMRSSYILSESVAPIFIKSPKIIGDSSKDFGVIS